MSNENKKEITLNDVVDLINKTREDLTDLIGETKKSLEDKIGFVENKIGSLEGNVGSLENKIGSLEDNVGSLEEKVGSVKDKIDSAVSELAGMTQGQFLESREYTDRKFDEVNKNIENIKLEVENRRVHVFDHKDLEHRVDKLEEKTQKYDRLFPKMAKSVA